MAVIATRLQSDGTLLLNGEFDEFTGATIANDDLMFWLDATQTASYPGTGNTWYSLINSANTATLTNGAAFVNTAGGVITFDGTDDYADFTSPGLGTGTAVITVELWANIKTTGARMPFGFVGYDVYLNGGRLAYNTGNSDQYGIDSATYTATNAIGNVAHYCFVMYNNVSLSGISYTNNKIYINGVSQTLSQQVGTQSASTRTFNNGAGRISGWMSDTNYRANMDLAVFRIYDRELTATEVATNFNAQYGRYGLTPISNIPPIFRVTSNTVMAGQFDEITLNGTVPGISRVDSSGTQYVSGIFDEFTGAPVVDSDLVLWLDAGQTTSYPGTGNVWTNLANNSANTTLVNSPAFDSQGWFSFNGTTQSANTGFPGSTTFTTDSDYTITCWARFDAYKVAANSIGTLTGAFNYQGYGLFWTGTSSSYTFGSYMRYVSTVSQNISAAVNLDTWYMVTQSYSRAGNFHRLYINDTLSANTTSISGTFNTNLNSVSIGIASGAGSDGTPGGGIPGTPFLGRVSQVMIYNRALSGDEVAQNFNALRRRYGI